MYNSIIITGVSGFIGGRFAHFFASKGYTVYAPLRHSSRPLINHPNIIDISYQDVLSTLHKASIDQIIHCAALTTANSNNFAEIESVNISLASLVCEWIFHFNPTYTLFCSTVSVYGTVISSPLTIDTVPYKPNLYGQSKLRAEEMIRNCCDKRRTSSVVLRLPGTVGFGSHGNIVTRIYKHLYSSRSSPSPQLSLQNSNSLFNNIVSISSLLKYWESLSSSIALKPLDIVTLLASSDPIQFGLVPSILANGLCSSQLSNINWSTEVSPSFIIDEKHAVSQGYKAPTTIDSLRLLLYDMTNFMILSNE
jgi:hypothetical protein